jgi:pyruvate formate lyase activating enzyme
MDPQVNDAPLEGRNSRRQFLRYAAAGLACAAGAGGAVCYTLHSVRSVGSAGVFQNDAPDEATWNLWQQRGWVREARHYLQLGRNVQCKLCPNNCLLEPGDRSHCRNRVNRDGKLYTLVYGNACSVNVDPIEKKPLFHFLPGSPVFSFASSGCGFRCLNCQNWEISQRKPEETKDATGESFRLSPQTLGSFARDEVTRMSMFPDDVVALARQTQCPSIAYTYSEPIVWYEYMLDTARLARQEKIKNVCVTCGFIEAEPLAELAEYLDGAAVNLKSFDDSIYRELNTGRLQPILNTLVTLKQAGVWVEVINLIVPTYTDKPDMIARMCDWLLSALGPDQPLHFSRFHPAHKLRHLPNTPVEILIEARDIARRAGLRHVYIGNSREPGDAETTFCPACHKVVVAREVFSVDSTGLRDGACAICRQQIPGVWAI